MSHWTTIKTQVRDLDALAHAAKELGGTLNRMRSVARGYGSNSQEFDATIALPQCKYDIGLTKDANGNYSMFTDWYTYGEKVSVAKVVGQDFKKLIQLYGVHQATLQAKKGMQVTRQVQSNGAIKLSITGAL